MSKPLDENNVKEQMKELYAKRKEFFKKADEAQHKYYALRDQGWSVCGQIRDLKVALGHQKGSNCPALKKGKGKYGSNELRCAARCFAYFCYSLDEMFQQHCYYCHLTHDQAKTAAIFQRIDKGKIQSEEET
jgi:hypothetical protein